MCSNLVRNSVLVTIAARVLPQFAGRVRLGLDQVLLGPGVVGVVGLRVRLVLAVADVRLARPRPVILHVPQGVLQYLILTSNFLNF